MSLVPLLVSGQFFGTLGVTIGDQTSVSVTSCSSNLTGTIAVQLTGGFFCSDLSSWVTQGECGNEPGTSDLKLSEISRASLSLQRTQNQPVTFRVDQMPYFSAATDGGQCGAAGVDVTHRLCAAVEMANDLNCAFGKAFVKQQTPVTIRYDTKAPSAPVIVSTEPFESAAAVTVAATDSDTASIRLEYKTVGATDFIAGPTLTNQSSVTIMNLTNGTTYEIRAIALDAATPNPNASAPSEVVTVTPRESTGFWDACVEAGCRNGGCNAAAAGPLGLFALAVLMLFRRMRR